MAKRFDFAGARKAGYSDAEIASHLGQSHPDFDVYGALDAGYSPEEISTHFSELRQPSRTKSILSAGAKGLRRGAASLNPLAIGGPVPEALQEKILEQILPSQEKGAERFVERAGELLPTIALGPEGLGAKALQLGATAGAGYLAEEAGLGKAGQMGAEIAGLAGPGLVKAASKKFAQAFGKETAKLPSGLTKLKALESENLHRAKLTSAKQKMTIQKLGEEAKHLTEKSVQKHLPLAKEIESGKDFSQHFEKEFGSLQSSAEKANPEIDVTPVMEFLGETREKYRGIPKLHADAIKIGKEVRAFSNNAQTSLKNLLKIYRSNNQKVKHIAETALSGGKQKEYVDFLMDMNRNIAKSFEKTLPETSPWVMKFRSLNKEYGELQATKRALIDLKPLFGPSPPTIAKLERLAKDEKMLKKLSLSMGKEGATEVKQIAQDLKKTMEAIKKIPKQDFTEFDKVFAIGNLLPGFSVPKIVYGALKAKKGIGYLLGRYLTTPARRKAYQESLRALLSKDLSAYTKATAILKNEIEKE